MDFPWACLIFHDVDLLPQNETNTYRCSKVTLCTEQLPFLINWVDTSWRDFVRFPPSLYISSIHFWWPRGWTSGDGSCPMPTILEALQQWQPNNSNRLGCCPTVNISFWSGRSMDFPTCFGVGVPRMTTCKGDLGDTIERFVYCCFWVFQKESGKKFSLSEDQMN